jgi:hypothetical protein
MPANHERYAVCGVQAEIGANLSVGPMQGAQVALMNWSVWPGVSIGARFF